MNVGRMRRVQWPICLLFNTVVAVNNKAHAKGPAPTPTAAPALSAAQQAALEQLRGVSGPARVADIATALGLHANTVREHLDALVDAGLAQRTRAESSGRGRPAWLYEAAAADADATLRAYAGMAVALAGHLKATSDDPAAAARELGRTWGRDIAKKRTVQGDSRAQVIAHLTDFGFAPQSDDTATIALTRCPLLDAARQYPDVTCQIHVGLVQGSLDVVGDTNLKPVLTPFAKPGCCLLRLDEQADE